MAGIGFELRKILRRNTFLSDIGAYLYAAMISSGPWVMSVGCLALLGIYRVPGFDDHAHEVFRATVTYTYAFSLIYVGICQFVVTRFLADRLFADDEQAVISTFITCSAPVMAGGLLLSGGFYYFSPLSLYYKLTGAILFVIVCMIWIGMIFISAVKNYRSVLYAFTAGILTSFFAAFLMGERYGLTGYLAGYTLGQGVIFFWLLERILVEFPPSDTWNNDLKGYFRKYWDLGVIGFVYNLAIWIDKFVFWLAPDSRLIVGSFVTHDIYEAPVFYAYLTIVPTMAIFLIQIETDFYTHYRGYYSKVTGKAPLQLIVAEKEKMALMMRRAVRNILIVQGTVTVLALIFVEQLGAIAGLSPLQIPVLRISLVGALLLVLLSIMVIILLYFDLRQRVLSTVMVFLLSNGLLSWLTVQFGFQLYGYGFTYACLISLLWGYFLLNNAMKDLEYITFSRQPVT
jgi:uncharacterized membrane protein